MMAVESFFLLGHAYFSQHCTHVSVLLHSHHYARGQWWHTAVYDTDSELWHAVDLGGHGPF